VLGPTCHLVGCPSNCARGRRVAGAAEATFEQFARCGWVSWFRSKGLRLAIDLYEVLCELEKEHGFLPGDVVFAGYEKLWRNLGKPIAQKNNVRRPLTQLRDYGLIEWTPGSHHPGDRKRASEIRRVVPIPTAPPFTYMRHTKRAR
jgi:hypothetical protein